MEPDFLEFYGVMMGDGCLLYYPQHRIYGIEIAGNIEQTEYLKKICQIIEKYTLKKPRFDGFKSNSKNAIRLVLYSKNFADYLINLGFLYENKVRKIVIPDFFLNWKFSKHIIRGIFEADGCIYFSKGKRNYPYYPRLEIKTSSKILAEQINYILSTNGFSSNLRFYKQKTNPIFVVYLSGKNNIDLWAKTIGFGSLKNRSKYLIWKRFKYYLPNLSLQQRLQILSTCGQAAKARDFEV